MATDAPADRPRNADRAFEREPHEIEPDQYEPSGHEPDEEVRRDLTAAAELEQAIESDPSLVPVGPSRLQVESTVLDAEEVEALLGGLTALLRSAEATGDFPAEGHPLTLSRIQRSEHESDAKTDRRDRRYSQLSPFAWLFPDDAGIGRSARHQQSHHLRARRRVGKKAGAPSGQAQGSLFGDHL